MGLQQRTRDIIDNSVQNRTEFHRGNVSGKWSKKGEHLYMGWLPLFWRNILKKDIQDNDVYVLYSYQTPMAWYNGDIWVIPDEKYSVSTTTHQGAFRTAIHRSGKEVKQDV